jgi:hypothetical protein
VAHARQAIDAVQFIRMFWIALAAQLSAPLPSNLSDWMTPEDVPVQLLKSEQQSLVGVHVIVEPSGAKRECQIGRSSGNQKLDSYTCYLIMKRARFTPARDIGGLPSIGVYSSIIGWWVGDGFPPKPSAGDVEITVSELPKGSKSPALVRLMFAVDANGRPSACASEATHGLKLWNDDNPLLVQIACDQLLKTYTARPASNSAGVPIPSVQDATVAFTIQPRR